ncbi:caffeoylshikimate esterase-like protein, partial [Tanacetum coccineum]
ESLGGLITMLMYLQSEIGMWSGLIFLAPLFVIPEEMVSKLHLTLYGLLFGLADTWAVMPDFRVGKNVVKDVQKLKQMVLDPKRYAGKLRVGTAREALRMTNYVQNNFYKVTVPFLVLHGTLDGLALHSGSEMLYEKAMTAKEDKGLKLYEGMYHSLISGEPDENVDLVLADMKTWIDEQTQKCGPICAHN